MSKLGIEQIELYIPESRLAIEDFVDQIDESTVPKDFEMKDRLLMYFQMMLNVKELPVEKELEIEGMIEKSLVKIFENGSAKPEDIDLIIFAQEPEAKQKENLVHFLQYKYKMKNAAVLTVMGHHCANVPVAISLADGLAQKDETINNVLIVTATSIKNEIIDNRLIGPYGVLGDASGTMLLSRNGKVQLKAQGIVTKGFYHEANSFEQDPILHFKGFSGSIQKIQKLAECTEETVDHVVVANASTALISQILSNNSISSRKIFAENFGKYGHLDCVDFMLNMKSVLESDEFNGESILTMDIGLAGSYVSSLFSKS